MATAKKAASSAPAPAKRKQLTPQERVAKLEADLAAARKKAEEKAGSVATQLKEKRRNLTDQIKVRQDKVDAIDAELTALGFEVVEFVADVTPDPEPAEGNES